MKGRRLLSNKQNRLQRHADNCIQAGGRYLVGVGIGCICIFLLMGCAHEPIRGPQSNLFEDTLQIYRGPLNHFAAVRRGVCPMHPSCSEYGRQAVQKHGFLIGWGMAMDRLLRCGRDELKHVHRIWVAGGWKFYDPVSANDSWWYPGENPQADQD